MPFTGWRLARPSLPLAAATAAAFVTLCGLGAWQLDRLAWKTAQIALREARLTAPAVTLAEALADPAGTEFRPIRLSGRYLHGAEALVGMERFGGTVGPIQATPLQVTDGPIVIVDRGLIPVHSKEPARRPHSRIDAPVQLQGHVRLPPKAGLFASPNDPARAYWYRIDPAAQLAHARLQGVASLYVQAVPDPASDATLPVARPVAAQLSNPHLGYVVTWFGLAAALACVFLAFHLRRPAGALRARESRT